MTRRYLPSAPTGKTGAQQNVKWGRAPVVPSERFGRVIPVCTPTLIGNETRYVRECMETNWISSKGEFLSRFESMFAVTCGTKHAVCCTSGTAALHLALAAAGIGPGDEVICPTFTIVSCANMIRLTGATPVFVDADPSTWTIDVPGVRRAIGNKTRAILAAHIYGHPCDMDSLSAIAAERDLWLLEDAAEAFGATVAGRPVGSLGDVAAFSLYANKNITTGEGGVVATNDDELAHLVRLLRDQAFSPETHFWHHYLGFNYRMTNLQAAIGLAQLERAEELVERRIANAARYDAGLSRIPGITLPPHTPGVRNVFWMYAVLIGDEYGRDRDELMIELGKKGIETKTFFIPMHLQPIYYRPEYEGRFPTAEEIAWRGLYLPSSGGLTADEIDYVVDSIAQLARAD